MSDMIDRVPCPFCGGPDSRHLNNPDEFGRPSHGIQCANGECWVCGPECETPSEAIAAWNRRAALPPAPDAEADKLRRTIAARDRRIERLVAALDDARAKGYVTQSEQEPPVVLSAPDAVEALVKAVEKLGLRELVAGWNGENKDEPYAPHPPCLGATIKTTCGVVYEIDAAIRALGGDA